MTDTDRLAALLEAEALRATVGVTTNADYWPNLAARLIAQGVRVGDGLRAALDELEEWKTGRRSYTNLGPDAPYTPDVIAAMDAQEVVKLSAYVQARAAIAPDLAQAARDYLLHDGSGIKRTDEWRGDYDAAAMMEARDRLRAALAAQPAPMKPEPIGSDPDNEVDAGDWFATQPAPPALAWDRDRFFRAVTRVEDEDERVGVVGRGRMIDRVADAYEAELRRAGLDV